MADHDCADVDGAITKLGKFWKLLLKKSDSDLKIDQEFTRPAVECYLEKFADKVRECAECVGAIEVDFEWQ